MSGEAERLSVEFERLHAEYERLETQIALQTAVVEAAQGVLNCLGEDDIYVELHASGGACLDILRRAFKTMNANPKRVKA